jgi:hypothetical protein
MSNIVSESYERELLQARRMAREERAKMEGYQRGKVL